MKAKLLSFLSLFLLFGKPACIFSQTGGWVYTVYNDADLPILTQDANQRTRNEWTYIRYDVQKRPISTGTLIDARTRAQHATDAATWASTHTQLESRGATAITGPFRTGTAAMPYTGAQSYPAIATPAPNTLSYYDDYDFDGDNVPDAAYAYVPDAAFPALTPHPWPIGLPTGTATRVKTPSQADQLLRNVQYYDSKNRVLYTYAEEYPAGTTQTWTEYNFVGWVMKRKTAQTFASRTTTILERNEYDHAGRLLRVFHSINGATETQIAAYSYNELGQMVTRQLHKKPDNSFAQTVQYRYTIRDWINTVSAELFSFKLDYNESAVPGYKPMYNGNISASTWTHLGETGKAYRFSYDRLDRLTDAESFSLPTPSSYSLDNTVREGPFTYDDNGNLKTLRRALNGQLVDDLLFRHVGNRLMAVLDNSTNTTETYFKDSSSPLSTDDYAYDANANVVSDANKRITSITYNNGNKPGKITFFTGDYYQFIYDEANALRRRIVSEGSVLTTTDYVAGFQYVNNVLDFIPSHDGYVKSNPDNSFEYRYAIKDHLASTRVVVKQDGTLDQKNDYYPFGLEIYRTGAVAQWQFKYNGKENQNRLGLGWYNYGFRYYDATIGRFPQLDPLARSFVYLTPFQYASNDPVKNIDLDGLEGRQDLLVFDPNYQRASPEDKEAIQSTHRDVAVLGYSVATIFVPGPEDILMAATISKFANFGKIGNLLAKVFGKSDEAADATKALNRAEDGTKKGSTVLENAKNGKDFEKKVTKNLEETGHTDIAEQVSVVPNVEGAKRVRLDNVSKKDGEIKLTDAKGSETASFTKNQKDGYPAIEQHGGTVVSDKGKELGYPAGTRIPPTKVDIVRPTDLKTP